MTERDTEIAAYAAFARELIASTVLGDPWIDGQPRFRQDPLLLSEAKLVQMYRAAEAVAAVYDELVRIVLAEPGLLVSFFALTPLQQAMALVAAPRWHGLARADVFVTTSGELAFAELNCDTPTGEPEACELGRLCKTGRAARDPNAEMPARFVQMIETMAKTAAISVTSVGIVYPTEMTEDLPLVRLYREWLRSSGYPVTLGSPYNLTFEEGRLRLFGTPIDVVIRHYKTDWWGERESPWDDEPVMDVEPLQGALGAAMEAVLANAAIFVNPFGSVLPQNKRAMAFMWEYLDRFSATSRRTIERFVPYSSRLESLHRSELLAAAHEWVLKADYGAEGNEVVIGRAVSPAIWEASLARARPGRWIAQRYFSAETAHDGEITNYGIYVIAGRAAGIYARAQAGANR